MSKDDYIDKIRDYNDLINSIYPKGPKDTENWNDVKLLVFERDLIISEYFRLFSTSNKVLAYNY